MSSAQPLKFAPAASKQTESREELDKTPTATKQTGRTSSAATGKVGDISSPHELTAFVETLLEQLDNKFDEMSSQILDRMNQMSGRVDSLEAAIQDIINSDVSVPQSPSPVPGTPKS